MRRVSKIGVVLAVALLVAGLAAPASAKKGGKPGPPSGTGLEVTVEPSSTFMRANSVGDEILFDITVTNTSGGDLASVEVKFSKGDSTLASWHAYSAETDPPVLEKNDSWSVEYPYEVVESDLTDAPLNEQSPMIAGTVIATAGNLTDSDDAVATAYPVPACSGDALGAPPPLGTFTFSTSEDYWVCSFTLEQAGYWQLTTELPNRPHGKRAYLGATVRDGMPGNWCDYDLLGYLRSGEPYLDDGVWKVDSSIYFPENGVCLHGGAGGDIIPVRNSNTFYLATWAGNSVEAEPCTTSGCP
jgi:hypothetical protein